MSDPDVAARERDEPSRVPNALTAVRGDPRRRAVALVVGVLALAGTVLTHPVMGPREFLSLSPPAYVAVASGLGAPAWGGLVRGVV